MGLSFRRSRSSEPVEVRSPLASKDEAIAIGTIAGVLGVGIPEALAVRTFQRASVTGHPEPGDKPKPTTGLRPGVGRAPAAHPPKTD